MRRALLFLSLTAAAAASAAEVIAVGFSPGNAEQVVLSCIGAAKKEIRVAVYEFTNKRIAAALIAAKKRGVDVQIVFDSSQEKEPGTKMHELAGAGIPSRVNHKYAIMHHKFMVVDANLVESGSYNYTEAATKKNAEDLNVFAGADTAVYYHTEWQRLWEESDPIPAK